MPEDAARQDDEVEHLYGALHRYIDEEAGMVVYFKDPKGDVFSAEGSIHTVPLSETDLEVSH